ncbi:MAG: hypothetical protein V7719_15080 [Psychroserpens sp.]|uniref:hypothetical protein n=1 Tax=Psychroserpens sp. TaxID=2020870 RepID=UPI0030030970
MKEKSKNSTIRALGIGITTLVLGGLLLGGLQGILFNKKDQPVHKEELITSEPIIKIESHLISRSLILGPNPGGVWASKPSVKDRFLWHHVVIHIQNDCMEPIYIDARKFHLYLSSNQNTSGEENFRPTSKGLEFQTKRLPSQWIEPGMNISGNLSFSVPEFKLSNGLDVNKAYNILRYSKELKCQINYTPY